MNCTPILWMAALDFQCDSNGITWSLAIKSKPFFFIWLWLVLGIKVLSSGPRHMDFRKLFPPWLHITAQKALQHYTYYCKEESTLQWSTLDASPHNWAQKRHPIKEEEKTKQITAQQNLSVCLRTPLYWLLKCQLQWILLFRRFWKYIWNTIC